MNSPKTNAPASAANPATNGSAHAAPLASPAPSSSPLPRQRNSGWFARNRVHLVLGALLLGLAATVSAFLLLRRGGREPFAGPTFTAVSQKLQMTIVERGTLESAENSDIICRVKSAGKGSASSTIIKWIIDDGTPVEKGQLLVQLDDSGLQDELRDQTNKVNDARAKWVTAEENYVITESQNYSDIETAKVNQILAEIELRKYLGEAAAAKAFKIEDRLELRKYLLTSFESDSRREQEAALEREKQLGLVPKDAAQPRQWVSEFLQTLNELEGAVENTRSDLEQWVDRSEWSSRMAKKGFVSRSQAESDRAKRSSNELKLKENQGKLEILRKFTLEKTATDLWSKLQEARRAVKRVETQAESKAKTAASEKETKKEIYAQEVEKKLDIEDQIRRCTIYSPQAGLVVYYVSDQMRFGSGSQQSAVAQGEPVRDGQKLMRIPNLAKMLVNVRVHEAMISRVKGETYRSTGFGEAVRASLYAGRDPLAVIANKLAWNELRAEFKDEDHELDYPGQKALVRVEAFATRPPYPGHVKSVATVAAQADWSSDVKVYQTMVSVDDTVENLKPGMSAEVTILADETSAEVLAIPIQSVVGNITMGAKRNAFVLDRDNVPQMRDIVVGMSNDKLVEVREGIKEGEKVVLNPAKLLPEKSDLRPGVPSTRRGADFEGGPGGGKKGMKKGPGGPGGGPPGAGGPPGIGAPGGAPGAGPGGAPRGGPPGGGPGRKE